MTRQNIYPNPEVRLFEAFMDFSGGLNTETANEKLRPNEYLFLHNVDLMSRSSAKRRTGRSLLATQAGVAQGVFPFYRTGQPGPDLIFAVSGNLYVMPNGLTTLTLISLTDGGSPFTFQTTLPIEATLFQGSLFVATGTKLVEVAYNSGTGTWSGVTVTPYTPTVMEAIYIGTNGLATNPSQYIQDGVSASLQVVGIQPATRQGTVNTDTLMTAYISKPAGMASVDYQWEYKKSSDSAWTVGKVWAALAAGKTWNFNMPTATTYDIRVSVRDTAVPATVVVYVFTSYIVTQVPSKSNVDLPVSGIQTCRKIVLHWDRLLLAGDSTNPHQMYVSDLNNPRFFPITNVINFDTGKQEAINSIIRFQSYLVIMTNTTIQTLLNKDPSTYQRYLINELIGCTCPLSAKVIGNQVIFKSFEGVWSLTPNQYRLETMNVKRIDWQVKSELPSDNDACAMFYDNQYWLCFPQRNWVYRYYFEQGVWTKDVSTKLNIQQFFNYGDNVYNLSSGGEIYKHNKTVYDDAGNVYDMIVETKLHDLSASFNYKKLRRLYIIARHFTTDVNLLTTVYADSTLVLTPDSGEAVIDEFGNTSWVVTTTPNFHFYAGSVLGTWVLGTNPLGDAQLSVQKASVLGKCRRVKVRFVHSEAKPCEVYGFGLEFKLKKP